MVNTSVDKMPDIQFCLLQGLHMEHPSLISPFASPSTEVAAQSQDHIGWVNLLLGQLATEWSGLQHNHLTSISSHHTATSWATGVVLAISHSLWILQFFWSTTGHWKLLPTLLSSKWWRTSTCSLNLAFRTSHLQWMTHIKGHAVDSLLYAPLMDHQCWIAHVALACQIGHQQCQAGIQGMQAALHTFLQPPSQHPLRVELHLGFGLFLCSAETDEILLTILVSGPWYDIIFP